jgi:D-aminoacyl-tRNA deacylase
LHSTIEYFWHKKIFFLNKIALQFLSMRVVIQRVSEAAVKVDNSIAGAIQKGLLVLAGIEDADTDEDIQWLSNKIVNLRIFDDENNADSNRQPNISVKDINGDILVVSQFTLQASTKKGNRPSYIKASKAEIAIPLYEKFVVQLSKDLGKKIHTGEFGADMKVALINDGPVTIWIDSKNKE